MNEDVTVEIKGAEELFRKLEALPGNVSRRGLRKALKAGAFVFLEAIVRLAPRASGFLAAHFNMRMRINRDELAGSSFVGPQGKMDYPDLGGGYREKKNKAGKLYKAGRIAVASVARFFEFGTKKMAKKPFMTQGFESSKRAALDQVIKVLTDAVERAAKD